jgi:hypothetical protein
MLGSPKNRQLIWALAAGGALGAVGVWYAYPPVSRSSAPAGPTQQGTPDPAEGSATHLLPTKVTRPASGIESDAPSAAGASSVTAGMHVADKVDAIPPPIRAQRPEFDIVRIAPSGDSVVAGRGAPGAAIALVEGDTTLARAVADSNGEVVFLPPPLSPGKHVLLLQSVQTGTAPVLSLRSVEVVVPEASKNAPIVALAAPERPSVILPDGRAPKVQATALAASSAPANATPTVAIRSAEAEESGSFLATGIAPPGSQSRLYLNGAFLAQIIADVNGLWSLKVEKGMRPGSYVVRADEVEPRSGKVIARAEVPFSFPVSPVVAPEGAQPEQPMKSSTSGPSKDQPLAAREGVAAAETASALTVIKEVRTATVIPGDSLWRISRKMLGRGVRYTQIYEANTSQIRSPRLVYPGQVFVMPSDPG